MVSYPFPVSCEMNIDYFCVSEIGKIRCRVLTGRYQELNSGSVKPENYLGNKNGRQKADNNPETNNN